MKINKLKTILYATIFIFTFYIISYIYLSFGGYYRPMLIGLNGVKEYEWSPIGMNYGRTRKLQYFICNIYFPLWCIDNRFWHTDKKARQKKYIILFDDDMKTLGLPIINVPPKGMRLKKD